MIKDLTEGNPQKVLWQFTIPLFVSVIFQQLYNIADSVIAGKFAGEDALAAVGASYPITMIFMAVAVGSNIGCSVVISQLFGAKQYKQMKTAVSTTMIASLVLSAVISVTGLLGSRSLMGMINTPENIFADGDLYLRIYIGGFLFLFLYNVATGIFTSLGDSKTPLYFLIGSSVGNIVLDTLFVAVFH
ncbi:MAG: MATE family efflux transporter, partial [Clostridiaceae bacterium]|nr:MATE family efflux transporter [Clostridiaceae bacterium]